MASDRGRRRGGDALSRALDPGTVAVVGATPERGKAGNEVLRNLEASFRGEIVPVNPGYDRVLGRRCHPTLAGYGGEVDLAVVCVPAERTAQAVAASRPHQVGTFAVVSSGFSEAGDAGREEGLAAACRAVGARLVGPNCVGLMNLHAGLNATFIMRPPKGDLAIVSQSGAVGGTLVQAMAGTSLGISTFASLGNMADVGFSDLLGHLAGDGGTEAILLYMEGLRAGTGRRFVREARRAARAKPVLAVKAGRSRAALEAIASHTGSLAGEDEVYECALKAAGVVRCRSLADLLDGAKAYAYAGPARGPRAAVVTNAGGLGVMAMDLVASLGLEPARLSAGTRAALRRAVPPAGSAANPADLTVAGGGEAYEACVGALASDPGVDIVLALCGVPNFMGGDLRAHARGVARAAASAGKPVLCAWLAGDAAAPGLAVLERARVPAYGTVERCAGAAAVLARMGRRASGG